MQELNGRSAVITGGGSGIGEGLAHACAEAGARVVVSDIELAQAERVASEVRVAGGEAIAVRTDVSQRGSVGELADRAYEAFGEVNLLFNNAGVMMVAPLAETAETDWQWTFGVNLYGVVHGVQAFVPRMREQPGPGHIVNTASIAGMAPIEDLTIGTYTASKYAIVGLSETLRNELTADGIEVSVVCPGGVQTGIFTAERNRQEEFGGPRPPEELEAMLAAAAEGAEAPEAEAAEAEFQMLTGREAADRILDGVRAGRLYIFTHPAERTRFQGRVDAVMADFDAVS